MSRRPRFSLFECRYSRTHVLGPFAKRILEENQGISIQPKILHNYGTRDRTALWINMMGNTSVVKRVVRNRVTRTVRAAFTAALAKKGYTPDGRREKAGTKKRKGNLVGSIEFTNLQFLEVLQSRERLDGEMDRLVAWLGTQQMSGTGQSNGVDLSTGVHGQDSKG